MRFHTSRGKYMLKKLLKLYLQLFSLSGVIFLQLILIGPVNNFKIRLNKELDMLTLTYRNVINGKYRQHFIFRKQENDLLYSKIDIIDNLSQKMVPAIINYLLQTLLYKTFHR